MASIAKGDFYIMSIKLVLKVGKGKSGNLFYALCADVGYTLVYLTFKAQDIAEILRISVAQLYEDYPLRNGMPFELYEL